MSTHLVKESLSQFTLLLDQDKHLLVYSSRQVQVQLFRASSHFADKLLMREDTVTAKAPIVLNALATSWQLNMRQRGKRNLEVYEEFWSRARLLQLRTMNCKPDSPFLTPLLCYF